MPSGQKIHSHEGWIIRTVHDGIANDHVLDEYRRTLSAIVLPEMVFHLNRVELVHEASGTVISFNALDALAGWRHEDLPPLQVRVAEEWRKAREHEIQQQKAVQLTYDWTYTTPYTCTVVPSGSTSAPPPPLPQPASSSSPSFSLPSASPCASPATSGGGTDSAPGVGPPSASGPGSGSWPGPATGSDGATHLQAPPLHGRGIPNFVCTGTSSSSPPRPAAASQTAAAHSGGSGGAEWVDGVGSDASGSSGGVGGGGGAGGCGGAPAAAAAAAGAGAGLWQPTADQIDRGLLMERDPILFYDEVPLYESDLDDNGMCSLTVKLRVMPRCWLVLLRLWVRVDGSMVRLRESRMFCRHDKPDKRLEVLQEVKHCEGTFAELRARGAPEEGPAYADADAASQVFQAVAPVGLKLLQNRKLMLPAAAPVPVAPGAAGASPVPAAAFPVPASPAELGVAPWVMRAGA